MMFPTCSVEGVMGVVEFPLLTWLSYDSCLVNLSVSGVEGVVMRSAEEVEAGVKYIYCQRRDMEILQKSPT